MTTTPVARARSGAPTVLVGALLAAAAVAWVVTDLRMAGMGAGTELGSLGFYVGVWVVMMAAMMFPSVWPMVLAYDAVARRRRELGRPTAPGGTAVFLAGYLVAWTAFGLTAYGVVAAVRSLELDVLAWDRGGPYLAGAVLVAAAAYELTRAKGVCLRHCRSPMHLVLHGWRDGAAGALRLGAVHGAWCVGCCWALMAALFALGVMSVGWMAFVAALIAAEKLLPWTRVATYGVAALLVVLGIAVLVAPDAVPGLGPAAMPEMEAMP